MGQNTNIEWAHHTFNPWRGCVEVSEGCDNCYAREWSKRNPTVLGRWGTQDNGGTRVIASETQWRLPIHWNEQSAIASSHHRVFCASLADVFEDHPELPQPRTRLWRLIAITPFLRWLLLTKRPANLEVMFPRFLHRRNSVWVGTTVENQQRANERIPHLVKVPSPVRFLSCEPLLGPIDLSAWLRSAPGPFALPGGQVGGPPPIGWVIVGGESRQGGRHRPMEMEWMEGIVSQCQAAGVPVFVKQLGTQPMDGLHQLKLRKGDTHGRDLESIPDWLRIREVPNV